MPGSQLSSFQLKNHPRHRFGVQICFDIEFGEPCRELALQGVSILIVHTALSSSDEHNVVPLCVIPTRAVDNHMFLMYSNFVSQREARATLDDAERFEMCGLSSIIAPNGRVIVRADGPRKEAKMFSKLLSDNSSREETRTNCQLLIADLRPAAFVTNFHRTPFLPSRRVDLLKLTFESREYNYTPLNRAQIQQLKEKECHKECTSEIVSLSEQH